MISRLFLTNGVASVCSFKGSMHPMSCWKPRGGSRTDVPEPPSGRCHPFFVSRGCNSSSAPKCPRQSVLPTLPLFPPDRFFFGPRAGLGKCGWDKTMIGIRVKFWLVTPVVLNFFKRFTLSLRTSKHKCTNLSPATPSSSVFFANIEKNFPQQYLIISVLLWTP